MAAAQAEWDSTPYPDTPGSFEEVGQAFDEGLIDGEAYDLILLALSATPVIDWQRDVLMWDE
ncbi:hypothetical protein [Arthrobacter sp. NA-172]|uniref:hypothetical protein n=1 Tax=Arthrobacter sp. NA-172 TaxID=3367524 RepID=UPI003754C73A